MPRVKLPNFVQFVQDNIRRIAAVYDEIEEVQQRFNGLYTALLAQWQERVEGAAERLAQGDNVPAPLTAPLEAAQAAERRKLAARIAELEKELAAQRKAEDEALQAAQAELERLRELNPVLDRKEEAIKARSLAENERIAELEAELKQQPFMTRLLGAGELKKRLEAARKAHARTLKALKGVRQEWVNKKKEVEARQAELRANWQQNSVAAAQAQAELDYLTQNLETLVAKRGAQAYLTALDGAPSVDGEWGETLTTIAEENGRLAAYRKGLASVAEALGLLNGLRAGMERFFESASKVDEERRTYNLRMLRLDVPRQVIQFHNIWAAFRKQVVDEKHLGQHPLEFVQVIEHYKSELSDKAIQRMFEEMGQALTAATKAWD